MVARTKPYRLTPPVTPEHDIQRQITQVLTMELAPPGKVSKHGVLWYSIDMANYAGAVPGIRISRGIIAGVFDIFILHRGMSYMLEIKTTIGEMSEPQRSVCSAVLASGGRVGVVRDADETIRMIDDWAIPRAHRVRLAAA